MKRLSGIILITLSFLVPVFTQPVAEQLAWDIKLVTDFVAKSTLTVQNRCRKTHNFRISLENISFMSFDVTEVKVSGGKNNVVGVVFNTTGLLPNIYRGNVIVTCLTCKSEPTCTQDREILGVKLEIPGAPVNPQPSDEPSSNPENPCDSFCEDKRVDTWLKEEDAAAAQEAANEARENANSFEKVAQEAADAARRLNRNGNSPTVIDEENKLAYHKNELESLNQKRQQIAEDLKAKKITPQQAETQLEELNGIDGLAKNNPQAKDNYAGYEAKNTAETARQVANAANTIADDLQKTANQTQKEAGDTRQNDFNPCVEKTKQNCQPGTAPKTPSLNLNQIANTSLSTAPNPCQEIKDECERLKFAIESKSREIDRLEEAVKAAIDYAERLERDARRLTEEATQAAERAKDPNQGRGKIVYEERGRVYTEADFNQQRAMRRQAWADYNAGNISAQEALRRANEASGLDSLDKIQDDNARSLSQRKYEAEQARKAAEQARAKAAAARSTANALQKSLEQARVELLKLRKALEECLKKIKEICDKQQREEAQRLAEERRKKAEEDRLAAAEQRTQELLARRKAEEARRMAAAQEAFAERSRKEREEFKYLSDNLKDLNLIPQARPEFYNFVLEVLQANDKDLLGDIGRKAADYVSAIGAIYNIKDILTNPCTGRGKVNTIRKLMEMINSKTGRLYTLTEAENKADKLCLLLRQIKGKLDRLKRLQANPE